MEANLVKVVYGFVLNMVRGLLDKILLNATSTTHICTLTDRCKLTAR